MIQMINLKKEINRFYKRNFMISTEIQRFKNEKNNKTKNNDNKIKIRKYDYSKQSIPFELYKWSFISNSNNFLLLRDLINYQKKKKKYITCHDLYKIVDKYNVIFNVNKNDMFVENEINNYIKKFINNLEYNLDESKFFINFFQILKEKEPYIYYFIYENIKILHILPLKFFWKYQNIDDSKNFMEEKEDDNEYFFNNINLNKMDFMLDETELNYSTSKSSLKTESNNIPFEKNDFKIFNSDIINDNFKTFNSNIENENNFKKFNSNKINENNLKKINSNITNENNLKKINSNITNIFEKKISLGNFIKEKKYLNTFFSSIENEKNILNIFKKNNTTLINNNNKQEKKIENVEKIILNDQNTDSISNENLQSQNPINDISNNYNTKKVEENEFLYNIEILDKQINIEKTSQTKKLKTSTLPVSQLSRAATFGKIFFDIAKNSTFDYIKNILKNNKESVIITEKNAEILANGLSKMRGIILKLGQMLSMQDEFISPILGKALKIVHNSADKIPKSQLIQILKEELGENYEDKFDYFNYEPFASASIGQVHEGVINNQKVAIKIQYPGIYESIDSDINNLLLINNYTNLILKNLYIENLCKEIKKELMCECNYINEAKYYIYFKNIFKKSKYFHVPTVFSNYVTRRILVTSYVNGIEINNIVNKVPQYICDSIGQRILYLCLHELFVFKVMNTDPNFGNFLYNYENDKLCLLDFGATRSYNNEFVDHYIRLVKASTEQNYEKIYHYSYKLNFFNGKEKEEMKNSHISSVILVGEPFKTKEYDFGKGDLAKKVYNLLPKIINNRLIPPRSEIYTLHRKLSGCYLICMKLKAKVQAADLFNKIYDNYEFTTEDI